MPVTPPPLQRPHKPVVSVRLDQSARDLLDQYCLFLGGGRQHVVQGALLRLFAQDAEFQEWHALRALTPARAKEQSA